MDRLQVSSPSNDDDQASDVRFILMAILVSVVCRFWYIYAVVIREVEQHLGQVEDVQEFEDDMLDEGFVDADSDKEDDVGREHPMAADDFYLVNIN
ncbi:hypothetical protein L596_000352 [Steinernema carpocapsae]|uniref:Uncharacterized protein n=1 Tax=Steinernema carpocapsae TaxID=34508 RepID=A0A4U8UI39_STECR|nr:hypothetical protein L596_000352 [Steinernema carpocapsae]